MPIKEKPKSLEFTFSIEGNPNLKYEIVYDTKNIMEPIRISYGELKMGVPVEFFTEVVDFLTSKGVIAPKIKISAGQINAETTISAIPLPIIIEGQENNEIEQKEKQIETAGPITSFDTSVETEEIIKEIVEEDISEKEKNIVIKENNEKEKVIPNRTVIKTKKFDKDNPRGAEREAAELRGKKESNFRRTE